ncbi:hypothetical protein BH11PSE8_BH11PSE8_20610 [soil metagenome]
MRNWTRPLPVSMVSPDSITPPLMAARVGPGTERIRTSPEANTTVAAGKAMAPLDKSQSDAIDSALRTGRPVTMADPGIREEVVVIGNPCAR